MKNSAFRFSLIAALIALSGEAAAVGLGELRGKPALGDKPRFEVDILGAGSGSLDAGCFRLKQPAGDDYLPWLKQATFAVRRGSPAVLEIRSDQPLRDPVLAVSLYVSCGNDIVRDYVVFASPPSGRTLEASPLPPLPPRAPAATPAATPAPRRQAVAPRAPTLSPPAAPAQIASPPPVAAKVPAAQDGAVPADDKIKSMEATVGELQQRAADLTQKIEQAAATPPGTTPQAQPETKPAAPAPAPAPKVQAADSKSGGSDWSLFAALFGALLALGAWFVWRRRGQGDRGAGAGSDVEIDPQRKDEHEERGGLDLKADPVAMVTPVKLDPSETATAPASSRPTSRLDSVMSISAATVDEHFEANPVMELAEIMLSFGRVKGAAQALQEYIDANPQEALKPWIRLMDVYRMAGMRHEFERVARELNKNFNVEVQKWELPAEAAEGEVDVVLDVDHARPASQPDQGRAEGIEGMPAIMEQVLIRWPEGDVLDYLNQLLRDNRGGTRIGFPLSVVSDILFLIELKEVSNKNQDESAAT